jgi:hypothetical protein
MQPWQAGEILPKGLKIVSGFFDMWEGGNSGIYGMKFKEKIDYGGLKSQ